uniref:Oligosaccharide biosynthesis protein Alg14 like n=1 Tax=uncultured Thiotrichaceae bacterium TaxID=298394 RepID=A0A6S6U298_9GAMM|nr:MAG: Oligosaccharide biosynthesis protein Alg14 like [uncultured Thiotrichaceae bacterium]
MNKKKKIFAISSPGGHWIQLTRICNGLEERNQVVYAMPDKLFKAKKDQTVYSVIDVSADDKWKLIPCALQISYLLLKERPDTIISTGAAPGAVAIMLGKLFRIRTIWVDSIANVQQISRAGRLVQKRADIFLTQWPHLSDDTHIQHQGSVL